MLQAPRPNKANAVMPPKVKSVRKKAATKKQAAKAPPAAISRKTQNELKHLEPLPVHGPDSELIATYNSFLLEWQKYLIDVGTNLEASVLPCDEIGRTIVNMPAQTPEGMLLKINAAAAAMGETDSCFPWGGREFQWDRRKYDVAGQVEYDLLDKLRDDIRRIQQPSRADGVSSDLAGLLKIWAPLDRASQEAAKAADIIPRNDILDAKMNRATEAEQHVRFAIISTPAKSLADIAAKFSVVKPYAELDWADLMRETITGTEGMLWSICGDLLALPDVPIVAREQDGSHCRVAAIADQFRQTIDKSSAVEGAHETRIPASGRIRLDQLADRAQFFKMASSHERATSIKGALFQLCVVASFVDEAIHTSAWDEVLGNTDGVFFNPPAEVQRLERDIYRLLYSAARAIAQANGISEKDYAGDYFLGIDPFKALEA